MGAALNEAGGMLVHGLGNALAAPDWPPLTVAELAPVVAAYPALGQLRRIEWRSPRPFAASGIVATAHARIFAKRHDTRVRSAADLAEEHAFVAHLRTAGARVPAVLAAANGATACAVGDRVYELHALADGEDLYRDAVSWSPFAHAAHAAAAGAALADLHRAAAGYLAPPRATRLLVADFAVFAAADPIAALDLRLARDTRLAAALAKRPWRKDFRRLLLPWHAELRSHLPALTPLWTHNDFHASNLLWHGADASARVASVVDFGLANRTSAVFDIATALERNTVEWLRLDGGETDIAHPAQAADFLRGYVAAHPLPAAAAAALPHLLPLVHAEFALSELAYFDGVLRDPAKSDLAYHAFLLGHAAWFATAHGQAFLQHVSQAVA